VTAELRGRRRTPLFISATDERSHDLESFLSWGRSCRDKLDVLILQHGGIVLRGFPIAAAKVFDKFIGMFPGYAPGYWPACRRAKQSPETCWSRPGSERI
jgi:hypothetical protein